tara:strand:+ start:52235 stop:52780 length:546 start_codon:yes stop_codon:yes gene_type:complete
LVGTLEEQVDMLIAAIVVIFPLCLAYAAFTDMFTMTIPNRVSIILVVAFALIAPMTGMSWLLYGQHFLAALVVFVVGFGLFGIGVMGGGDAKLLSATSLWFGWNMQLLEFMVLVSAFGGVLTLIILMMRSDRFAVYIGRVGLIGYLTNPKLGVPYGIAVACAGFVCFPATALMQYAITRMI